MLGGSPGSFGYDFAPPRVYAPAPQPRPKEYAVQPQPAPRPVSQPAPPPSPKPVERTPPRVRVSLPPPGDLGIVLVDHLELPPPAELGIDPK